MSRTSRPARFKDPLQGPRLQRTLKRRDVPSEDLAAGDWLDVDGVLRVARIRQIPARAAAAPVVPTE